MYILEYVTEWENGESVLNRFECETLVKAYTVKIRAQKEYIGIFGVINHSFRIEEVN